MNVGKRRTFILTIGIGIFCLAAAIIRMMSLEAQSLHARMTDMNTVSNRNIHTETEKILPLDDDHSSSSCWRACLNEIRNNNHIVYNFENKNAGLLDRMKVYHRLANLAGYLCATLHIPKPRLQLSASHNNNSQVDPTSTWSDLFDLTWEFPSGNEEQKQTVLNELNYPMDLKKEGNSNGQWLLQSNTKKILPRKGPFVRTERPWGAWEDFFRIEAYIDQRVKALSQQQEESPNEGFLWVISAMTYQMDLWKDEPALDLVRNRDGASNSNHTKRNVNNNMSKSSNGSSPISMHRPLSFPGSFPVGVPGCDYAHYSLPKYVKRVADSVWDEVVGAKQQQQHDDNDDESKHSNPTSQNMEVTGHFHLRRGDGSRFCNTSLAKLRSYLTRSFVYTDSWNITLLLGTDEHDRAYLDELHRLMPSHVQMLELDPTIWEHTDRLIQLGEKGLPSRRFLNNFFVFAVGQSLKSRVNFRLVQRRGIHCPDFEPIRQQILLSTKRSNVTTTNGNNGDGSTMTLQLYEWDKQ